MGGGIGIATESADVILVRDDLGLVLAARDIGRRSCRWVKQNVVLAFTFNGIGIPLSAVGLVYPVCDGCHGRLGHQPVHRLPRRAARPVVRRDRLRRAAPARPPAGDGGRRQRRRGPGMRTGMRCRRRRYGDPAAPWPCGASMDLAATGMAPATTWTRVRCSRQEPPGLRYRCPCCDPGQAGFVCFGSPAAARVPQGYAPPPACARVSSAGTNCGGLHGGKVVDARCTRRSRGDPRFGACAAAGRSAGLGGRAWPSPAPGCSRCGGAAATAGRAEPADARRVQALVRGHTCG